MSNGRELIGWLVLTYACVGLSQADNGTLDLYTTGKDGPMLSGNLVAILSGGIIHIGCSLVWPEVRARTPRECMEGAVQKIA